MTSLADPDAIRHFQSLCDACQELTTRYHSPSELRLYADGYLHALRKSGGLDPREKFLPLFLENIEDKSNLYQSLICTGIYHSKLLKVY